MSEEVTKIRLKKKSMVEITTFWRKSKYGAQKKIQERGKKQRKKGMVMIKMDERIRTLEAKEVSKCRRKRKYMDVE